MLSNSTGPRVLLFGKELKEFTGSPKSKKGSSCLYVIFAGGCPSTCCESHDVSRASQQS